MTNIRAKTGKSDRFYFLGLQNHCSPPGSSVHEVLQARILEWVAISFSKDFPNPGIEPGSPSGSNHCRQWLHLWNSKTLLGRKAMTNLDRVLNSRDITLPTKVHLVKAMVFPVVMYGWESWTVKKAEHQSKELMLFNCGVGENSWESLGLSGDQTSQS